MAAETDSCACAREPVLILQSVESEHNLGSHSPFFHRVGCLAQLAPAHLTAQDLLLWVWCFCV